MSGGGGNPLDAVNPFSNLNDKLQGLGWKDAPDLNFFGLKLSKGDQVAEVPMDPVAAKKAFRDRVAADASIDEEARTSLLAQIDANNVDPNTIAQQYADALDPNNQGTASRKQRIEAQTQKEKAPGINMQTRGPNIFGGSGPAPGPFSAYGGTK